MIITCENCETRFTFDESLLKPEGSKVRCSQCRHIFIATPSAPEPKQEEPLSPPSQELDFDSSESDDLESEDFNFDSEFETVDFDQDLEFDESDLGFDSELSEEDDAILEEPQDQPDSSDGEDTVEEVEEIEFPAEEIEFEMPDLEDTDFEMPEEQDDALEFETDSQDAPDEDAFPELGMESPDLEVADSDEDEIEEIEFEELNFQDDSSGETNIEISFDEDDTSQGVETLSLEMEPLEPDELDLGNDGLSLESEDFEFETEDDSMELDLGLEESAPLETEDAEADDLSSLDHLEMDVDTEDDREIRADDLIEPDLELSFEDDLTMEEIAFDEPSSEQELQIEDTDDDTSAFPEIEEFQPQEPEPEADLSIEDDDEGFDPDLEQDLEDEKFAEYDDVLEQDTEPAEEFLDLDEELNDPPVSPPEADPAPEAPVFVPPQEASEGPLITPPLDPDGGKRRIKKRRGGLGAPVKILVLLFFLIIAAYLISLRLGIQIPFMDQVNIPFITQAFKPAPPPVAATGPIPNDASTNGKFVTNETAGRLFIVTGKVDNPDKIAYSNIQVRGTLLTKGNKKAATQVIYCGNVISDEDLKSNNISDITKQLSVKQGMQNTNINVRPGTSVRFMLVFSNLPENLTNFTVEVMDYKQAGPQ